jgi:hypothetical protein
VFQNLTAKRTDVKRQYQSETKLAEAGQIEALIATLSGRLRLLNSDIDAEEERTNCCDRRDSNYSLLARTLIARRDNLFATLAVLQERLATIEAPEWNNS